MKKIILAAALVGSIFAANAQEQGAFRVGLRGSVHTAAAYDDDLAITMGPGLGLSVQYAFTDNITAEVAGNYFLKSEKEIEFPFFGNIKYSVQVTELNVNVKYYVTSETLDFLPENLQVYGLGGLNRTSFTAGIEDATSTENEIGFNAGAGVDYLLSDNFGVTLQGKYVGGIEIGGETPIVANLGAFLSF